MNKKMQLAVLATLTGVSIIAASSAMAAERFSTCAGVTRAAFEAAANTAATETDGFGFGLPMWATLADPTGRICYVYSTKHGTANTGASSGNQAWLGSRVISAQKANTANAFSLNNLAISTGAVYVAVQPGGSLYGLQHSNPVDASKAYDGNPALFGTASDPLTGKNIGGVNVFGGGVALYNASHVKTGAVGASGDTSCRDHAFAYRLRLALGLTGQPNDDGLKLVATPAALFQQPACGVKDPTPSTAIGSASDFGVRP
ncbi:MAG: heme-binding protein [Methylophilaceae bacterium]|nr:heme-binding protein [Methylophilaceae bacterium]